MPDQSGKLTPEEIAKAHAWISRWTPGTEAICPICHSTQWSLGEHLVQPVTLGPGTALQLGGIGYPQLMLVSTPCGYTIFVNAVISGVLVPNPPPQVPSEHEKR